MSTVEVIKLLCKERGLTVSQLESRLGFGNGSICKSNRMSAQRIFEISRFFGVEMEYLVTGVQPDVCSGSISALKEQVSLLEKMSVLRERISMDYAQIYQLDEQLSSLKEEYLNLVM